MSTRPKSKQKTAPLLTGFLIMFLSQPLLRCNRWLPWFSLRFFAGKHDGSDAMSPLVACAHALIRPEELNRPFLRARCREAECPFLRHILRPGELPYCEMLTAVAPKRAPCNARIRKVSISEMCEEMPQHCPRRFGTFILISYKRPFAVSYSHVHPFENHRNPHSLLN